MKSVDVQTTGRTRENRLFYRVALLSAFVIGVAAFSIFLPGIMRGFNDPSGVSAAGNERLAAYAVSIKAEAPPQTISKASIKRPRKATKRKAKLPDLVKAEEDKLNAKREEMNRQLLGRRIPLSDQEKKWLPETDEGESDADLPSKGRVRIDKGLYLEMRDEYVNLLRGVDLSAPKPFNPSRRVGAIELMNTQQIEQDQARRAIEEKNSIDGNVKPLAPLSSWVNIGPFNLPNGQTQQFPTTAPVNGRTTAVAVDPTNSNKVYIGTAQGGVWRSLDGGTTWTAIFDTAQSLSIGAIALAPSNPTILYVGTGEPNNSADSFFGVGVYRIDNVDTTATLVGPINPSITTGSTTALTYNCFNGRSISKILVHPTDPATIFVSTATGVSGAGGNALSNTIPPLALRGVFRSTNATAAAGSVTFSKIIVNTDGSLANPGTGNTSIFDIAFEPGNATNRLPSPSPPPPASATHRPPNP